MRTFLTNIFAYFLLTQAALPQLEESVVIINTASVTDYRDRPHLIATGVPWSPSRSPGLALAAREIRINGVPDPMWTPLIPSTFPPGEVETFATRGCLDRSRDSRPVAAP